MEGVLPILLFALFAVFGIAMMFWHFSRSKAILEDWARENGYTILSRERRYFARGPFFWTTSKGQDVYYVQVRTSDGHTRSGYVKCGGFFAGMMSDAVRVEWDDE